MKCKFHNGIRKYLDIEEISISLIFFPYLIEQWGLITSTPYFSFFYFALLIGCIVVSDLIMKSIVIHFDKKARIFSIIVWVLVASTLYGWQIFHSIQHMNIHIRARFFLPAMVFVILVTLVILSYHIKIYRFLNFFFLILGTLTLIPNLSKTKEHNRNIDSLTNGYKILRVDPVETKPIVLLVADEYSSPDELFKVSKDSTVYAFAEQLEHKKWIVRSKSYSHEINTINSISSLFNFNLSANKYFSTYKTYDIIYSKLMNAALADSLKDKNIQITNYGIVDVGHTAPLMRLWFYPKCFIESVFIGSRIVELLYRPEKIATERLGNIFYYTEAYNKHILSTLCDTLGKIKTPRSFAYVHLFMPHNPKSFEPEFKRVRTSSINDYIKYWKFTNQKLIQLLSKLTEKDRYRIIVTGDHGLRKNSSIDPRRTFTAFYGFDPQELEKIASVQDLGTLINCYLN